MRTRKAPNIILIGARGSGKTTIGRLLAPVIHMPMVDLDERIIASFPESSIREIWALRGEGAWRAAELNALEETLRQSGQIISLGGGTVMIPEARRLIEDAQARREACVVYLSCSIDELQRRLMVDEGDRPSLHGRPVADELPDLVEARHPTYEALADERIDTTAQLPEACAQAIARLVERP